MTGSTKDLARFQPLSGLVMPRFAGPTSFFRLPQLSLAEAAGAIDIGILGLPFDAATTNRPGARLGPRQVREASCLIRLVNEATRVNPYALKAIADVGDVAVSPVNVLDTLDRIEAAVKTLVQASITPLSVGGDHLVTLPILRALGRAQPLGMIHIDAHSDTWDEYFGGERFTHGTPFRRAIEEGVLDGSRTVQIGIRGTMYSADEREWALAQGIRIIDMEEVARIGIAATTRAPRAAGT
jgi:guanidinopropionase